MPEPLGQQDEETEGLTTERKCIAMNNIRVAAAPPLVAAVLLVASAVNASAGESYTVRRGDTLSGIAASHGTSWPALHRLNRDVIVDPHLIYPGQVIKLGSDDGDQAGPKPKQGAAGSMPARPATGQVTSGYGMRTHPITGEYKQHTGTDFAYGDGQARAARAGMVSVEYPEWAGNLVIVDHGGGVVTRYAHLASVSVSPGERVAAGQVVGRIGERGLATGPHLHFEVLVDGEFIDPLGWLGR